MIFNIVLLIVLVWVIVSQNNRISKIEKMLKEGHEVKASSPSAQAPTQPSAVAPMSASATQTTTAPIQKPKVASEEASGRFLGKIGIAAVLVGIAFFLKYAFDNNWIGPVGRVMIGIIAGLGFLGLGQYLRAKYLKYSDLIIGGGIAILYLSVFAANSFYHLIDPFTTGVFMFVVTVLSFVMSIVNATPTLAVVGVVGGFATPFLVGSHENAMLSLFAYLTILNLGVLGVSFFKKWPKLNIVAFVGTVTNFIGWYVSFYEPIVLGPTLGFVFISFLIFLIASVARVIVSGSQSVVGAEASGKLKADQADYLLLGANAFLTASIGYIILNPEYHGILGFASVLLAVIYCIVAVTANKFNPEDKALNIFLPGLAVVFLSIAVPMQFSGPWIAIAWFIESAFLYAIASFISNRGFQVMGIVVYALGIIDFAVWTGRTYIDETFTPIFNTSFVILVLAVIVAYAIAYMYRRFGSISVEIQKRGIMVFVIVANVLSVYALSMEIVNYYDAKQISLSKTYQTEVTQAQRYNTGYDTTGMPSEINQNFYSESASIKNRSNTLVSILWAIYAAILTAIGFARRVASVRRLGLVLFVITALKVVVDVWSLGQIYRIVSFIVFGIIALVASFAYAKYKDRLKEIV
jgi:uncharacterized membrane protein